MVVVVTCEERGGNGRQAISVSPMLTIVFALAAIFLAPPHVFISLFSDMDARKLKEGPVLKYKTGFLSNKFKKHHLVLFSDSRLCWYEEKVIFLFSSLVKNSVLGRQKAERQCPIERCYAIHLCWIDDRPNARLVNNF